MISITFSRMLPPASFASFTVSIISARLLSKIYDFGFSLVYTKFLPLYFLENQFKLVKGLLQVGLCVIITMNIFFGIGFWLSYIEFKKLHLLDYFYPIIMGGFLVLPLLPLKQLTKILITKKKIVLALFPYTIVYPLFILLFGYLLFVWNKNFTDIHAVLSFGLSAGVVALFLCIWVIILLYPSLHTVKSLWHFKEWLYNSWEFFKINIFNKLLSEGYFVLCSFLLVSKETVAIFSSIFIVVFFSLGIKNAVLNVFSVELSVLLKKGLTHKIQKKLHRNFYISLCWVTLFLVFIIVCGKLLLNLFNPLYVTGYPALVIFSCSTSYYILLTSTKIIFLYSDKQRLYLLLQIAKFCSLLIIGIPLVIYQGILGAVIAEVTVVFIFETIKVFLVKKMFSLSVVPFLLRQKN